MKNVTQTFKENIKKYGRQLNAIIIVNNTIIDADNINNINHSFNSSLFKSIMNTLEVDSNIPIKKGEIFDTKVGIKFDSDYEYINFNKYKVKTCEKQEDTLSYKIIAYDRMIESMIDYDLQLYEEITVREYLIKICERLGWNTSNIPADFINSKKLINPSLHIGIQYTFRDVLDEIATITCSFLYFKGNEFYLGYATETNEVIDEEYLSEDDVTIKEKYFINSLVFSRAEESDNIYRKDDKSVELNGLHEFRISDNQLLSTNDRDLYIDEMFEYLKTFEFYLYDIKSTGIMFFEACDRFTFNVHGQTYSTIILNNEINITQGLEERLYIDKIEETETEYKYADTTDKKINQTYHLVDKQNQVITQLVNQQTEYEDKFTQVTQDVNAIKQEVDNKYDATRLVTGVKQIELEKCVKGYLLSLRIYGNNSVFKQLYPADDLYPSDDLFPYGDSRIVVTDEEGNKQVYELRVTDVLRANDEVRDEYILEDNYAKVIRRVNKDGTTKELEEEEIIGKYTIYIAQGTNTITIQNYNANLEARFVQRNNYTDQFATRIDMNSAINQSAEAVTSTVTKTLYNTIDETMKNYSTTTEMHSKISQTAESINSVVSKKVGENEIISKINQSAETVSIQAKKISLSGKTLNLADNMAITSDNFKVTSKGNLTCSNGTFIGQTGKVTTFKVTTENQDINHMVYITPDMIGINYNGNTVELMCIEPCLDLMMEGASSTHVGYEGIVTPTLTQTSKATDKKNFEKMINALDIVQATEIYKYNLKTQNDTDKKHIGFVVGENFKYSSEVTAVDKNKGEVGVDLYSMVSVLWKAVQEQQEQINNLKKGE